MNILIVVAHSDDEVLGCGGTIARHVAEGDVVDIVYMADGTSSRNTSEEKDLGQRKSAAIKAQKILGIRNAHSLDFPDNKMDSLPLLEIVRPLEEIIHDYAPSVVYTHHHGDLNVDHRITHQAVMTACRPQPGSSVKEIYTFEVVSSSEWSSPGVHSFIPNFYNDISQYLDKKTDGLNAYTLEMRQIPHARSIENVHHLASYRGCSIGVNAAEAFMVMRLIR